MEDSIKIIAIDPGGNTGVSIYTVGVPSLTIISVETFFIDLTYYDKDNGYERLKNKLLGLENTIINLIEHYQPHILAIEDTFVNTRFPKSAIYLSQYIATIELAVMRHNRMIKIFKYAPKLIKKCMAGKGNADKDEMTLGVANNEELNKLLNPYMLTEHEVDSVSIGYLALTHLRNDPLMLMML